MRLAAIAIGLTALTIPSLAIPSVAQAADTAAAGCPWRHDIEFKIGHKRLSLNQSHLSSASEPIVVDGYQLFPLPDRLKIEVIGPSGDEWEIGLTQVVAGKRCRAFYAGNAVRIHSDRTRGLR